MLTDLSDRRILLIIAELGINSQDLGFFLKAERPRLGWAGLDKKITSLFKYLYYAQLLRLSRDTIFSKKVLSYKS